MTFLFTDVEGSVAGWERHPRSMRAAQEWHDERLRSAVMAQGGHVFSSAGDGAGIAFHRASDALRAAIDLQCAFTQREFTGLGRLRVRMAIHAGGAQERDGNYLGPVVNRAARLLDLAHGGQVVVSAAARELLRDGLPDGVELRDMGEHRLRGLERPEPVHLAVYPDLDAPRELRGGAPGTGMPRYRTSFRGRSDERRRLVELLREPGLVTLVGAGGVGKTRLAVEVARRHESQLETPALFADLTSVPPGQDVADVVAAAAGVRPQQGREVLDTLAGRLPGQERLVILDNCEHVLTPAARFADRMLSADGRLRLLATSRRPLGIPGERRLSIGPLDVEEDGSGSPVIQLFLDRLPRDIDPVPDVAAVAELCRHLDGIPLAIELAAARIGPLTVEQITARLTRRPELLVSPDPTVDRRHATLRNAIAWSLELLDPAEQVVFRRLGVFPGSFEVEAAETIAGGDGVVRDEVLPALLALHDGSLLTVPEGPGRYRLLETVRALALELAEDEGELVGLRDGHLRFVLQRVETIRAGLFGPREREAAAELAGLMDDVRAAITWALEREDPPSIAALVEEALRPQLADRRYPELRQPVLRALGMTDDPQLRSSFLRQASFLSWLHGGAHEARRFGERSIEASRQVGSEPDPAVLVVTALASSMDGQPEAALRYAEELRERGPTDPGRDFMWPSIGFVFTWMGRPQDGREVADRSIRWAEEVGSTWIEGLARAVETAALVQLDPAAALSAAPRGREVASAAGDVWQANNFSLWEGYAHLRLGRPAEAAEAFAEAVRGAETAGNLREGVHAMEAAAAIARRTGHAATAARLLDLARHSRDILGGHPGLPVEVQARARAVAALEEILGREAHERIRGDLEERDIEPIFARALSEIAHLQDQVRDGG